VRRKKRKCANRAVPGSDVCSLHDPVTLAAAREQSKQQQSRSNKKARVDGGDDETGVVGDGVAALNSVNDTNGGGGGGRISATTKRMANPFAIQHMRPIRSVDAAAMFEHAQRPLHVDVGCAR
jgi:hypothetical protein